MLVRQVEYQAWDIVLCCIDWGRSRRCNKGSRFWNLMHMQDLGLCVYDDELNIKPV